MCTEEYGGFAVETDDDFQTEEYVPGAVKQLACTKCGGREFIIGKGAAGMYLTMASCVKCKNPFSVHEG